MNAVQAGGEVAALLREIGARHGAHVAERVYFRLTGLKGVELTIDDFYRQHPEDESTDTEAMASDLGRAYAANQQWRVKAVRGALAGFDWTPEELPTRWRAFIERLLLSDERSQLEALSAVLEETPDNEPFLEDLFALCEAINDAKPLALKHQRDGRWPNPATKADDPQLPIELALELKSKREKQSWA
jgi:hypothetical protein